MIETRSTSPPPGASAKARVDPVADVADPGVSRQRESAAADQLGARVGLGVVRRRAHQSAVEPARTDQVVEDLGADLAGVEHGRALAAHPVAVGGGELGRRQTHVVTEAESQLRGLLVLERGDHVRERASDRCGGRGVDLLPVQPADVVRLEDRGIDGFAHRRDDA